MTGILRMLTEIFRNEAIRVLYKSHVKRLSRPKVQKIKDTLKTLTTKEKDMISKYDPDKGKAKAYIAQLAEEDEDLAYFDPDDDSEQSEEEYTASPFPPGVPYAKGVQCRRCQTSFPSTNLLHKHFQTQECNMIKIQSMENDESFTKKPSFVSLFYCYYHNFYRSLL